MNTMLRGMSKDNANVNNVVIFWSHKKRDTEYKSPPSYVNIELDNPNVNGEIHEVYPHEENRR